MKKVFLDRIKQATLTKKQLEIADYVLKNESRICFMSSNEIARELHTSDTSVIRFSRALGYQGFMDMQKDLQEKVSTHITEVLSPTERLEKNFASLEEENLVKKAIDTAVFALQETMEYNGMEKIEQAAALLYSSKRRYVIGMRGCRSMAMHLTMLLQNLLGNVTEATAGDVTAFELLQDACPEDAAVLFSFSRYGAVDTLLQAMLIDKKVPVIVITDHAVSPVAAKADILLIAEAKGLSFFNSISSGVFLIELLVTLISRKVGIDAKRRFLQLDQYIGQLQEKARR